jgi:predicted TIM-barrel fold metal-dependent hydrolase
MALLDNSYDIAHDFAPADYAADVAGQPVSLSVACEFGASDPVLEASWVQRCSDAAAGPAGFIAG